MPKSIQSKEISISQEAGNLSVFSKHTMHVCCWAHQTCVLKTTVMMQTCLVAVAVRAMMGSLGRSLLIADSRLYAGRKSCPAQHPELCEKVGFEFDFFR